jgi:hypothetical protein
MIIATKNDVLMSEAADDIHDMIIRISHQDAHNLYLFLNITKLSFLTRVFNDYVFRFQFIEDKPEFIFFHIERMENLLHAINDMPKSHLSKILIDYFEEMFHILQLMCAKYSPLISSKEAYNKETIELVNQAIDDYYTYQ